MSTPINGQRTGPLANPVKQTIYRGVQIHIAETLNPQTGVKERLFVVDTQTEQLVFPMSIEIAQVAGRGLMAPGVVMPQGA